MGIRDPSGAKGGIRKPRYGYQNKQACMKGRQGLLDPNCFSVCTDDVPSIGFSPGLWPLEESSLPPSKHQGNFNLLENTQSTDASTKGSVEARTEIKVIKNQIDTL